LLEEYYKIAQPPDLSEVLKEIDEIIYKGE